MVKRARELTGDPAHVSKSAGVAIFPYVVVRLACAKCEREGSYRLARLAAKYGLDIRLPDLLAALASDCVFAGRRAMVSQPAAPVSWIWRVPLRGRPICLHRRGGCGS